MKNLNQKNQRIMKALFTKFVSEADETKKNLLQSEIIAKFGIENFESALKLIPKKEIVSETNVETILAESGIDVEITNKLLSALNAIGITDKLKSKGAKSIFKKDFNNKSDRTKCRNSFQNCIGLYLLNVAHNKKELSDKYLKDIKDIANKYYIAEISFANVSDYCTDNMDESKKELIKLFIANQKELVA